MCGCVKPPMKTYREPEKPFSSKWKCGRTNSGWSMSDCGGNFRSHASTLANMKDAKDYAATKPTVQSVKFVISQQGSTFANYTVPTTDRHNITR